MPRPITAYLTDQLARQLQEHGVVVWYDSEGAFRSVFETLDGAGLTKLALETGLVSR